MEGNLTNDTLGRVTPRTLPSWDTPYSPPVQYDSHSDKAIYEHDRAEHEAYRAEPGHLMEINKGSLFLTVVAVVCAWLAVFIGMEVLGG